MHLSRWSLWFVLATAVVPNHPSDAQPAGSSGIEPDGTVELMLPRAVATGEALWLRIRAGRLAGKSEIVVTTETGELVGTVSAFGASTAQAAATYLLPLPRAAIAGGRVRLRLAVDEPGSGRRGVRTGEVSGVELAFVPVSK